MVIPSFFPILLRLIYLLVSDCTPGNITTQTSVTSMAESIAERLLNIIPRMTILNIFRPCLKVNPFPACTRVDVAVRFSALADDWFS
jgi:hypothetical protein